MGGQFQSNSTDLFSTAAAVTRRYGSAAGFTCVYLCSTIRVKNNLQNIMEIISVEAIIAEQLLFFLSIQILCKSVMWVGKYIVGRCSARK